MNVFWEKIKTVTPDTWARSVCFIIALVNQMLATLGKDILPFAESDVYQLVSLVATIITGLVAWWKNNSFTDAAIKADKYMNVLKSGSTEDVESE